MMTTITPVTFLAQEIHHSASCLASAQLVHEVRKLPTRSTKIASRKRPASEPYQPERRSSKKLKTERCQYLLLKGKVPALYGQRAASHCLARFTICRVSPIRWRRPC